MTTRWRTVARDLSLLFCAALLSTLASFLLAARLGVWLVASVRADTSMAVRLLLSLLVLDLIKAPALLLCALALRRALTLSPTVAALVLVGVVYGLELLTSLALPAVETPLALLAARLLAGGVLVVLVRWVVARGRRKGEAGKPGEGDIVPPG